MPPATRSPSNSVRSEMKAPAGSAPSGCHCSLSGFHWATVLDAPPPAMTPKSSPSATSRCPAKTSPKADHVEPFQLAMPGTDRPPAAVNEPEASSAPSYTAMDETKVPEPQQSPVTPPSSESHTP